MWEEANANSNIIKYFQNQTNSAFLFTQLTCFSVLPLVLQSSWWRYFTVKLLGLPPFQTKKKLAPESPYYEFQGGREFRVRSPVPGKAAPSLWPLPLDIIYERQVAAHILHAV